jgi:iron complex transport system permease protein
MDATAATAARRGRPAARLPLAPILIVAAAPVSLGVALAVGSVSIPLHEWWTALWGGGTPIDREIIWHLRAPRAFAAFSVGGLLALAGAVLQVLLRNPLADPYLLGISGGASVGALLGMLSAVPLSGGALALTGALFSTGLLSLIGRRGIAFDPYRIILAGVALAAGAGAIVGLILALAPAERIHGMLFWLMGDLADSGNPLTAALVLVGTTAVCTAFAADLDALGLGAQKAATLGVAVVRTQWIALACAVAATAAAVLLAGSLGFVGLVVPHLVRLAGYRSHRALIPLAVFAGGALVTAADTAARSLAAPIELPVGSMLALIGVPALVWLIVRLR